MNPNMLDEGIRDFAQFLWKHGFSTVSSCQGGKGHPHTKPTVTIVPEGESFNQMIVRLMTVLSENNIKWVSISRYSKDLDKYLYLVLDSV